jgi:flagellar hook-associated protein 2
VTKIKAMVDATNFLINTVKNATATSTDAASRGPLSGDYTAAQIGNKIRDAIAGGITGSDGVLRSSSVLGISLDRTGTVNFDETKLRDSLGTDAAGVLASLSRGGFSSTSAVKISAITASANPGTRQIDVTQAATKAGLAGLFYPAGAPSSTANISVLTGGVAHAISFQIGNSNLETLTNLNASLQQDNIRILATDNGGSIDLTASREGSAYDFTVSGDMTGASTAGLNALATIDGVNVVGVGRSVTAGGVVFDVSAVTGGAKAVTFTDGLAGALSRLATQAGSSSGTITSASDALTSSLTEMNKRIDDWDTRLATLQTQYTHQFTAMDTMISQLNSQLTSLNSLLPSSSSN